MRESRTYGSMRGARGNSRPYRVQRYLLQRSRVNSAGRPRWGRALRILSQSANLAVMAMSSRTIVVGESLSINSSCRVMPNVTRNSTLVCPQSSLN